MRILIVPFSALAVTKGPQMRVTQLIKGFRQAGIETATCAALDPNFVPDADIHNYYLDTPIPLGLPSFLGRHLFQIASQTGLSKRKTVHSFEEVLFMTGALDKHYFAKSVASIRSAIQAYVPDAVYSEFNLSAIVAAKLENVKVFASFSYPTQPSYACSPRFSKGLRVLIDELGLPTISSALELFDWADYKIIPSSFSLEPVTGPHVLFTGPFMPMPPIKPTDKTQNKIVAYMGSGTISPQQLIRQLTPIFDKSPYEVYIAGAHSKAAISDRIHIAPHFNFNELLPEAAVMIHHGGQNSMMDALRYNVPQLICPGKVFERKYNAEAIVREGAGLQINEKSFNSISLKAAVQELTANPDYKKQSYRLSQELSDLGGVKSVIHLINSYC